jgi:predicted phosphoadenosine phosphosulfate sulfurtransferase
MRTLLGRNTFDLAVERMIRLYEDGHRPIVSFSGGKDSTCVLEVSVIAASEANRLPVEVVMRDDEIMVPGVFEYCERVAARPEVDFHWQVAHQPVINCFNRNLPFFWAFDTTISPGQWVREPPPFAYEIEELHIQGMVTSQRFPVTAGDLFTVTGLRAAESPNRIRGVHSSGGYVTKKPNRWGSRFARPIYDWADGDVWKAIGDNGWDYAKSYDVMHRFSVARRNMRVAPPTQRAAQLGILRIFSQSHPRWFDRVCARCPGVREAVRFGRVSMEPQRRAGELWSETFQRECIDEAPQWIADRCRDAARQLVERHRGHSSQPFPEARQCVRCGVLGSWMRLSRDLYMGDPFSFAVAELPAVEPGFFREGAGTWGGGKPSWG